MPLGGKEMQRTLEADKRKGALSEVNKQYLSNMQKALDEKNIEYLCFEKDRDTVYMVVWKRDQNAFLDVQKEVYDYHFSIEHKKEIVIPQIYHGSDHVLEVPKYGFGSTDADYGQGFYLTKDRQKADEWAASMGNIENATTNEYVLDLQGLNILNFDDYGPLTWIAEIAYNRHAKSELALLAAELICDMYKVDTSNADIIIGYRAGGVYMNALNAFLEGAITVDETERLFRMANLGEQYFLKSEKAFEQIVFTTSHKCEKIELQTSDMLARAKMQKFLDNRYEEIRHGYRPELKGLTVDDVTANKFNYNKDTNSYELEGRGNV